VIKGDFVTSDAGTGVVHCSPGFGEEDYSACLAAGIITAGNAPVPVDQDGKLTPIIEAYAGMYIKDADKVIMKDLKD
jgi:isoleucyl-tRNA synthetase